MTHTLHARPYRGVFPVVPTMFDERGGLDLDGQQRALDFMIDAGSQGLCILANFSEQFVLTNAERDQLMAVAIEHVRERVPVIGTTTHFSSLACAERSRCAQDAGAAMVMIMPPYHGATIRVSELGIHDFLRAVSDAISIPIMIQDAPSPGRRSRRRSWPAWRARSRTSPISGSRVPQAAAKLRELIAQGGEAVEGPWDGEEAITLMPDLDAGATGVMTGGGYPDGIRQITDAYFAGRREEALEAYARWLPLINHENRQCGLLACKALMKEGGITAFDAPRAPVQPLYPAARTGLLELARP